MATLASLTSQALDTVQKRDFSPSSPADTANVFLAALAEATAGSSSGGVGSTVPVLRAAGTQAAGTITLGGTAQELLAANTSRSAFAIQNTALVDLYVNFTATATTSNGFRVAPGATLNVRELGFIPTGAISVIGGTTSQTFVYIYS